ncbi:MAG: hypothetical protein ACLP7F_02805 [Acidimicrobiales bacterium]
MPAPRLSLLSYCALLLPPGPASRRGAPGAAQPATGPSAIVRGEMGTGPARRRWLSRRALLLHLTVVVVAPGCGVAGWWQATRALAGNGLSWVYSIEWPIFGLIAIAAWWQLVHEDPDAYEARKRGPTEGQLAPVVAPEAPEPPAEAQATVEPTTARLSTTLVVLVGAELLLGVASVFWVPVNRPSGWVPSAGQAVYLAHAAFGLLVVLGAFVFLVRVRQAARTSRLVGWIGFTGVVVAAAGGVLTEDQSLVRFLGMVLMFFGPVLAVFAYIAPFLLASSKRVALPSGG